MTDRIFTFTLTSGTFTFIEEYGVRSFAVNWLSGTVTVTGSAQLGGVASTALSVEEGMPISISDDNSLAGCVIDATAGSCQIIARR